MKKLNNQKGFTLIELVVVIVILGILAATAAPKFIDLQDDARTATLEAVKASMQSAATLVYSKSLIEGNQTVDGDDAGGAPQVTVNGNLIDVSFGYPRSDAGSAAEWTNLLDLGTDFVIAETTDGITVYPTGQTAPTVGNETCTVTYAEATSTADADRYTATVTDC